MLTDYIHHRVTVTDVCGQLYPPTATASEAVGVLQCIWLTGVTAHNQCIRPQLPMLSQFWHIPG